MEEISDYQENTQGYYNNTRPQRVQDDQWTDSGDPWSQTDPYPPTGDSYNGSYHDNSYPNNNHKRGTY